MDHYLRTMFGYALGRKPIPPISSADTLKVTLDYLDKLRNGFQKFDRLIAGIDFHECFPWDEDGFHTFSRMWVGADQVATYTLLTEYSDNVEIAAYCLPSGSTHVDQTIQLFYFRLSATKEGNRLLQASELVPESHALLSDTITRIGKINEDAANEAISRYSRYQEIGAPTPPIQLPLALRSLIASPIKAKVQVLANKSYYSWVTWSASALGGTFVLCGEECAYIDSRDIYLSWKEIPEPAQTFAETLFFEPMEPDEIERFVRMRDFDFGLAVPWEYDNTVSRLREAAEAELRQPYQPFKAAA